MLDLFDEGFAQVFDRSNIFEGERMFFYREQTIISISVAAFSRGLSRRITSDQNALGPAADEGRFVSQDQHIDVIVVAVYGAGNEAEIKRKCVARGEKPAQFEQAVFVIEDVFVLRAARCVDYHV